MISFSDRVFGILSVSFYPYFKVYNQYIFL